jgi:hypothetical protein
MSKQIALISEPKEIGLALFEEASVSDLLSQVKARIAEFTPDTSTAKGRKEIASMAAKVSSSKTYIDGLGKTLVADEKERLKLVDKERKRFRDECDILRDKTRLPLTEWEAAEAERIEKARLEKEYSDAREAAFAENDLIDRERKIAAQERAIAEAEELRIENERLAKVESDRIANEERIRIEAKEAAEREAAEKLDTERKEAAKREADAVARKELAEQAAKKAIEDAEQAKKDAGIAAEKSRIDALIAEKAALTRMEEAKKQAKIDADIAAQQAEERRLADIAASELKAKQEAEAVEAKRKADEVEQKRINDERAANVKHRASVHKEIKLSLIKERGLGEDDAIQLVLAMSKCEIKNVFIKY